ncbi:hypothetical protein LR48_Vigan11g149700 [Vigna angularis]|uniref:Late embryogenesis abundant protein LEA-2 subgroup domain-containing protein n=1 Tax=Phaseolus angularis TaxID=3914 RepID=A0A0L9VU78_PHAAN|nr:hypothetical protein LR48_Vigan11g149700 [Vigna angularis]
MKVYVTPAIIVFVVIILGLVNINNYKDIKDNEEFNFYVSNATVLNFSYNTTTTTFTYNLALFVIILERFEFLKYVKATASYLNHTFASKPDETLVQGFTGLRMRFNGEYVVPFTKDQLLTLNNNQMAGLYNITIRIWPSVTYSDYIKARIMKKLVLCDIQFPLQSRVLCGSTNHE